MPLFLPPAVSVNKFVGGFKSVSDYTDLADTETSDALNTVYGPNGDIDQRLGSERLYNSLLFSSSATATGRPITGHYFFDKLGDSASFQVVAAGDSLFNYSSATATVIRTTLTDNSETFWSFIQIQDPRSAGDDIVLMTNGTDPIQVWNGSASAVVLNAFTSATQVPIAQTLLNHKERVYAINILDSTDADATVRVFRTGFGTDGNSDPHRFTENFYVGGSSKDGEIINAAILHDQIFFYKRGSVWKFNPGSGDNNDLIQIEDNLGLLARHSLVTTKDFHIFLSEQGVQAFDGTNFVHLSDKVDDELFDNSNETTVGLAKAIFNHRDNQYILYYPSDSTTRLDRALTYDLRPKMKLWQPPVEGREVNFISSFLINDIPKIIYGDYLGYLYQDQKGNNDNIGTGINSTVTSGTLSTLTDSATTFSTTGNGLAGAMVTIRSGLGEGQRRPIRSISFLPAPTENPTGSAIIFFLSVLIPYHIPKS